MLRPQKMSRVSITGSKRVMDEVVEELHKLNLVHLSDYDGDWEGFETGDTLEGGEEISEKLVQVRAVERILDVEEDDLDEDELVKYAEDGSFEETKTEIYSNLEDVRADVNQLEDEANEVKDELRSVRDQIRSVQPFVSLGISLNLLRGFDSIDVVVLQTQSRDEIDERLRESDIIDEYEIIGEEDIIAIAAATQGTDPSGITDDLVGVEFTEIEVPEKSGNPEEILDELKEEEEDLEAKLEEIEKQKEEIKEYAASFLVSAEEHLSIEAERSEAPLRFATTENSFYAEGWIPAERTEDLEEVLADSVESHVDIEVLATVDYDDHGYPEAEDYGDEDVDPPVLQDNPEITRPFELLVNTVNRPKYTEIDPTLVVFLTFPFAFGFMIGDMGYGLMYVLIGLGIYKFADSDALKTLGIIAIWAGAFTFLFGYLYDDLFGIHVSEIGYHLPMAGVFSKGLEVVEVAQMWLVASILFGLVHLNTAYIFGFVNDLSHGIKDAVMENVSWMLVLNGFFIWVFSLHGASQKPDFITGESSVLYENSMFSLGFQGVPAEIGIAALIIAGIGAVMLVAEEGIVGAIEMPAHAFGHVLSYLRIMAVLLAKGGMAFVVNLFVFGAYEYHGHMLFGLYESPSHAVEAGHGTEVAFEGLLWIGVEAGGVVLVIAGLAALLLFVLGHVVVLLLGITAAGIQMVRLEYVEFFGKFYDGGGRNFQPFGKPRKYTKEGK